jgi:serine/threonine-protein kinase HipA
MMDDNRLDVYLHGRVAGTLERRSRARLRFTYTESWVAKGSEPLSLSLPIRPEPYEHDRCAPFFEGLLPEGDFLKAIARTLHVSASNPFQLLTELGGECAGAISVAPAGGPEPGQDPRPPRWLGEEELGALLRELPRRPLIAAIDEVEDGGGFRLSLAGAQDKVGVLVEDGRVGLSHGRPPTTAILKAPIPHVEESVANEAFCMQLAAHVDLGAAAAAPRLADSHEYLLVHRYDRSRNASDGRVHQEDFCQALGLVPAVKYEKEGGPAVADCAELIRRHCSAPARDITVFLDALLFNFAIANYDAHAKNYSLLLDGPGSIRLAPLYDLISTVVFAGTDRKLAMRYGGENRPAYVRGRHLDRLAGDLGVKPALVRRRALDMCERLEAAAEEARRSLPEEFQDRPILEKVLAVLVEWSETLVKRASEAGAPAVAVTELNVEATLAEVERAGNAIVSGINAVTADIEQAGGIFIRASADFEELSGTKPPAGVKARGEDLAHELERPALALKQHGREIYDAVVDFGSLVEWALDVREKSDDGGSVNIEFLRTFQRLAAGAESRLDYAESLYGAISGMEETLPSFRTPVRNMRAGLRDLLDARTIICEWGERAKALEPGDDGEPG